MKNGQVWVETVIYTLIGLTLIGLALGIVVPKIESAKDRAAVEQSIDSLVGFDEKISEVIDWGAGNIREVPRFTLKRGELYFDSGNDTIYLDVSDMSALYSEEGIPIDLGRVEITTTGNEEDSSVRIELNYSGRADIRFGNNELKKFESASIPYSFAILNAGVDNGLVILEISETG